MVKRFFDRRGLGLAELVVSLGILVFMSAVVYGLIGNSQMAFSDMSMGTQLRDGLRQALQKVELELRNTGYSGGAAQFTISAGAGAFGSDTIRFSVPITCSTATTFLNASGDPANWGAGLTWGCNSSTCMDANNSCTVIEYKYINYALNSSGQLVRSVLGAGFSTVASAVIGRDMSGMTISYAAATRTFTVTMTAQKLSGRHRMITETASQNIRLLN